MEMGVGTMLASRDQRKAPDPAFVGALDGQSGLDHPVEYAIQRYPVEVALAKLLLDIVVRQR